MDGHVGLAVGADHPHADAGHRLGHRRAPPRRATRPVRRRRRGPGPPRPGPGRGGCRRGARTRSAGSCSACGRNEKIPPPSLSTTTTVSEQLPVGRAEQGVGVVQEGQVPDQRHGRLARQGHADRRGHDAVDPVGAPVGQHPTPRSCRRTTRRPGWAWRRRRPGWRRWAERRAPCGRRRGPTAPRPSAPSSTAWAASSAARHPSSHSAGGGSRSSAPRSAARGGDSPLGPDRRRRPCGRRPPGSGRLAARRPAPSTSGGRPPRPPPRVGGPRPRPRIGPGGRSRQRSSDQGGDSRSADRRARATRARPRPGSTTVGSLPRPATITPRRPASSSTTVTVVRHRRRPGARCAVGSACRQRRRLAQQRFREREVQVDGARPGSRRIQHRPGGQRAPRPRGLLPGHARLDHGPHGPAVEAGLVDGLRGPHAVELRRSVGRADQQRHTRQVGLDHGGVQLDRRRAAGRHHDRGTAGRPGRGRER